MPRVPSNRDNNYAGEISMDDCLSINVIQPDTPINIVSISDDQTILVNEEENHKIKIETEDQKNIAINNSIYNRDYRKIIYKIGADVNVKLKFLDSKIANKQDILTPGKNITITKDPDTNKTIISAIGGAGGGAVDSVNGKVGDIVLTAKDINALNNLSIQTNLNNLEEAINLKQDNLISGRNIKTINEQTILGSGNLEIVGEKGPKGDKGDPGEAGPQGPQGIQGLKGEDGLTTAISVNGDIYEQVDGVITLPNYPDDYATEEWVESQGYLKEHQSLNDYRKSAEQDLIDLEKQDKLKAGRNITISDDNVISAVGGGGGSGLELDYEFLVADTDGYATIRDVYRSGYLVVANIVKRHEIDTTKLEVGTRCYIENENKFYKLILSPGNTKVWADDNQTETFDTYATKEKHGTVSIGENLTTDLNGKLTVDVTDEAEKDSKKPISSGAVYDILGDIKLRLDNI